MKNKLKARTTLRPRGRKVDFDVRDKLVLLLNTSNYRRDHLIEYLHKIQDSQGAITKEFKTALADLMEISQTEVYEVATFYHHFDIVDNDDDKPPSLTVRVCDSVSCEINGANKLADELDEFEDKVESTKKSFKEWEEENEFKPSGTTTESFLDEVERVNEVAEADE